jgi:hypothetical protein
MNPSELFAVLIIGLGTWLFYLSRKRVFDRRNAYGREVFSSYGGKLVTRLIDWSLVAMAFVLAGTGILYLAIAYKDSWGWIVLLPVAWFFVVGYVPVGKR